jgi:hypothetical protein
MTLLYSPSTGGFYDRKIHGLNVPDDVVEIDRQKHAELLQAEYSNVKQIKAGADGTPETSDRPPRSKNELLVAQILDLEATVTPRRLREAALGIDGGWLKATDDSIAALRKKMVKK